MKQHVLIASALALASSGSAFALDVYITGATAYRAILFDALNGSCVFSSAPTVKPDGATGGSTSFTFSGPVTGLGTVNVYCSFSGSVKGASNLKDGTDITTFVNLAGTTFPADANLSFADNQLENMPFDTTGLGSVEVGVVPFIWVKSANAESETDINNVTSKIIPTLFGAGAIEQHLITGDASDTDKYVAVVGRAWTSGTRIITAAETGYGVTTTATFACLAGGAWDLASSNPGVVGDNNLYGYGYGYESGSTLKTALMTAPADAGPAIGMMSVGEARSSSGGGSILAADAQRLKHSGVTYTRDAVRTGQYTFWSYERLVYKNADNTGDMATFITKLVDCLDTQAQNDTSSDAPAIALSDMGVQRANDGAPVTDKNTPGLD